MAGIDQFTKDQLRDCEGMVIIDVGLNDFHNTIDIKLGKRKNGKIETIIRFGLSPQIRIEKT